ncbi:MAG: alpha/beta hydrolase, partial [Phycisphaeraceae bacterium]
PATPATITPAPAALVIHGGGWNAMDKHGLAGIAQLLATLGYAAYNINYRLLDHAPWPACGDDCLAAARFLLDGDHPAFAKLDRSRIVIVGASAGGHLALMTGLRLDRERVRAIVSIAGPADLVRRFARPGRDKAAFAGRFLRPRASDDTDRLLAEASPINHVTADAPPLLCIHSRNDELVRPEQSQWILDAYRAAGAHAPAHLHLFDGPGKQHGIWIEGTDPHQLLPEPANALQTFLTTLAPASAPR